MKVIYKDEKRSFEIETTTQDESKQFMDMMNMAIQSIHDVIRQIMQPYLIEQLEKARDRIPR